MGKIRVEKNPNQDRLNDLGVKNWATWTCEISEFDWHYDENEACFFLDGEVVVEAGQERVEIKRGNLAFFPKNLDCRWRVIKPVKKVYKLG